jgi:O-methyltransferase
MDLQEVRQRIAAADSDQAILDRQQFEAFCSSIIASLPRTAESTPELMWAYEQIIYLRIEDGRPARALRVFKQYLSDCALPADVAYDVLYQAGLQATGTGITPLLRRHRFHSLLELFRTALPLEGMVAECGCFRGLSSYLMCSTLKLADAAFDGSGYRIFDSFAGLSVPGSEDLFEGEGAQVQRLRHMTRQGSFAASLDKVKGALSAFPRIEYFPGWIPAAFPDETATRYRFVHVDVDVYQPTRDSLESFYPRLVPGGMIVCDDYNWPGARMAVEEVCARVGAEFATTPYTQAYIVKRA